MANKFGTEQLRALALNVLPILKNQLRLPALIDNQYDATRVDAVEGSTISVKRPVVFIAKDFVSQIEIQSINRRLVDIKLNTFKDISFELTVQDMTFIMKGDQKRSIELLAPAFAALADELDSKVASLWKTQIPFYVGDAVKSYDSVSSVIQVRKALVDRKIPINNIAAVLSTAAYAELLALDSFRDLDKIGDTSALKEASLGRKFQLNMFETQVDLNHIVGTGFTGATAANIQLNAASTATVSTDNLDVVNTEFNTMVIKGLSTTGTVLAGDLFSITQAGKTYQFIVKEDVTAAAGIATGVKTFPVYRDTTTGNPIVFAANSLLVVAGQTVGSYEKSCAFNKQAFAFVPVSLPMDGATMGAMQYTASAEELSFRITGQYDINTKKTIFSVDFLAGFATLYPELAEVIIGG